MSDKPKDHFEKAAGAKQPKKQEAPIRDKDNADKRISPPTFAPHGERNRAPRGATGIKQNLTPPPKIIHPDISKGDPDKHRYISGNITSMEGYSFVVKQSDQAHSQNLNGGRIEKMDIRKSGVSVARFDRGWDVKPQTSREAEAARKVEDAFNDKPREFKPIAPKSPDKDHGHER